MKGKKRGIKKLKCPECGWDGTEDGVNGGWFRYLETVTNDRRVEGFNADGVLEVSGDDHIAIDDCGENHRLMCGNCMHEFPIPEGIEIDFV